MSQPTVILATASYDHTIRFWEAKSGHCYRTIQYPDSIRCEGIRDRVTHEEAGDTATVITALLSNGATCVGKTVSVMDEFSFGISGENKHYGTPTNPLLLSCIPRGSSSGSAVAVDFAAGLVDFAIVVLSGYLHQMEEVKLLGLVGSPFVCRVQIALRLKGVEYKYLEENLSNKSDLLLKYNPVHKKVPVFVHNEKPIAESLVIVEYIDETWKGNPILPSEPYQRALARFWSKFIDDKVVPTAWKSVFTADEKEREKNIEESSEVLQFLENEVKDHKFFGGEEFGFVDIAAVFIAFWIPLIQEVVGLHLFTAEKFPKLYKWSQEILNHPVVKECLPPREQLFARCKAHYESIVGTSK